MSGALFIAIFGLPILTMIVGINVAALCAIRVIWRTWRYW